MWAGGEAGPDRLGPAGTSLDKFMEQGPRAVWPCWDAAIALVLQGEGFRLSQNGPGSMDNGKGQSGLQRATWASGA